MNNVKFCLTCQCESRVIDSRQVPSGIMRRRECPACGRRWTTIETRVASIARKKTPPKGTVAPANELSAGQQNHLMKGNHTIDTPTTKVVGFPGERGL